MYVYKGERNQETGDKVYAVGYFDPEGDFKVAARRNSAKGARALVSHLNGGAAPVAEASAAPAA